MGRWRSALVIRYSANRGATGITRDVIRGLSDVHLPSHEPGPSSVIPSIMDSLDSHSREDAIHRSAVREAKTRKPHYLINNTSGMLHKHIIEKSSARPWRTLCGDKYEHWDYTKHNSIPLDFPVRLLCSRCCKSEKLVALSRATEDISTDSSMDSL